MKFSLRKYLDFLTKMTRLFLMFICLATVMAQKRRGRPDVKPGFCPPNTKPQDIMCAAFIPNDSCRGDGSCPGNKKCCVTWCYPYCVDPVFVRPPAGRCPPKGRSSGNPCPENPYHSCNSYKDCPRGDLCCMVGCARSCVRPV